MKIDKIKITSLDEQKCGLHPVELDRLGNVIVISGSNGSGKTRFINLIFEKLKNGNDDILISNSSGKKISDYILLVDSKNIVTDMRKNVDEFINQITDVLRKSDTDVKGIKDKQEINNNFRELDEIGKLVSSFTGKQFEYVKRLSTDKDKRKRTLLFGNVEFNYDLLSEGEKYIFNYMSMIYNLSYLDNIVLNESIILIDEPELHLHPEIQMDIFEGLRNLIGDTGQLIIATHSMSIIAASTYDQLFFSVDNNIKPPSRENIPQIVHSLIGYKEKIEQHISLFNDGHEWTYTSFISQCLRSPTTVHYRKNDPQLKMVLDLLSSESKALLLDYGCGKARLFEELKDNQKIKYHGYDLEISNEIDNSKGTFFDKKSFKSDKNKYDYIVLCNVLHEIPILEWMNTFSIIQTKLKDSGYLLILEDKKLIIGERPNHNGFIILSENNLDNLFDSRLLKFHPDEKQLRSRLYCVFVNHDQLMKVTVNSILDTLKDLQRDSIDEFKKFYRNQELINKGSKVEGSRRLAFLSIQNMNAKLAYDELSESENSNKGFNLIQRHKG